jgi:hypothetical protein
MKTETKNNSLKGKRLFQTKKILIYGVAALILILIIGLFLAPEIVRNYLNKHGKELAGREIHINNLRYNYFTSTLQIEGFKYFEKNSSDVFMAFDTFMVNMKPLKLLKDEIYIQQLQIINPTGNFIQNDTVFNFDDLITFFTGTDSIETDSVTSASYKLNLNNLEMKNGSVYYTDMEVEHTYKIEEVSFIIPQILWNHLDSSKADIEFELADGGSFAGSLNYNMEANTYNGFVRITKMAVNTILPYVQQSFAISKLEGTASGLATFSGSVDDLYTLTVSGDFGIDSFGVYDNQNRKVLGLEDGKVYLNPSKVMKYQYRLDSVIMNNPYMYLALEDSLFNFEKMMVDPGETDTTTVEPEEYPMEFVVNNLTVNNGLIDFSDQRFSENFNYELSQVTVNMDTLALVDEWVNINASMKLNKRGTLNAKLGMNPTEPMKRIELDYVLTDFQLPDINIYSKYYAGFPILFGNMYYMNKTKIINHQLESNNQLIIRNVEMGRKIGGLYDVPIKLALFILKDINGDIILDIPVKGDLSDPKVRIGPIVWDTFKSFMFKIVASPFKALGNLLGVDPKELEEITFDYGDTTIIARQTRSFDLLLDLEKKKPELQIELHYLNDKKLERTDAAQELSYWFYNRKYGENPNPNNKKYLEFLKKEAGKDSLVIQDYELLIAPAAMVDSVIQQREEIRLGLTRKYLTEKNDSTAIHIFDYNKDEVLNIGSRPRFEVRYILKEDAETK